MVGCKSYEWKYPIPVDAQVAGEYITALEEKHGAVTRPLLVDESRPASAPLHVCFEWDDAKAAEYYRQNQAGKILRSITVIVEKPDNAPKETRAFVSVKPENEPRRYVSISVALSDGDLREQLLRDAYIDLLRFKRKYETLSELSGVFTAIDEFAAALKTKEKLENDN